MDNQSAQPSTRVLTVVVIVLAVLTEAASAVLTVLPFQWAMAPLGGLYAVVGGFVWPLVLHAVAVAAVLLLRRDCHRGQGRDWHRLRWLFVAAVGTIAGFTVIGSLERHGFDPLALLITVFAGIGGPITLRMALPRP
ncbi:hypothetical protein [Actinophytocola sediminis]